MNAIFEPNQTDLLKPAEIMVLPSYMDRHQHQYAQIVIAITGRAEFDVAGEINLIGPGQGCIVRSNHDHRFGGIGTCEILVLNFFDPELMPKQMTDILNRHSSEYVYFQLDFKIQQLIQMFVEEIKSHPDDELLSQACRKTVIALLDKHIKGFEMYKKGHRLNMELIDRYIEQSMANKISVSDLAACVFLGESQFHLLFKSQVGMTPHQYVLSKRIDKAKQLIKEGQYSFAHIAEVAGFSGQSAFTHSFTRLVGLSPSLYRKQG
ncbi:MAG: AraC family transcriptional regulator [Vibrio sp.]